MKKKGFTLVELLAVIVILAIIAVIATPLILNVIDNAKKGASENSALGYIEGIEKYIVLNEVTKENSFNFEKGLGYNVTDIKDIIEIKGDKPTEGWVCIGDKKEVTKAKLKINNYVIEYKDNKATVVDEEIGTMDCTAGYVNVPLTYQSYTTGTKDEVSTIYYNPETAAFCDETEYSNNSDKLGKTGCLKWYAIENSDSSKSTVDVILDHNTTATVAWNSTGSNTEMKEVKETLENDISLWNNNIKLTARLIEANEVASITGNTSFNQNTTDLNGWFYLEDNSQNSPSLNQGESKYSWLFDYTNDCIDYGCSISSSLNDGYWTATPVAGSGSNAWRIGRFCNFNNHEASNSDYSGVRPVITISKVQIS